MVVAETREAGGAPGRAHPAAGGGGALRLARHAPPAAPSCCRTPSCAWTATQPYLTDEGHLILDCAIPTAADPAHLDVRVECVPGVVEHGLFLGMAERALLGRPDGGVDVLEAPA